MKRTHGSARLLIVGGLLMSCLVVICLASFWLFRQWHDKASAKFAPPLIFLDESPVGDSFSVGSFFTVSASVVDPQDVPLELVELWMDGRLMEGQEIPPSAGADAFYPRFDVLMPSEGVHSLSVRAINGLGIVGQSQLVHVFGRPKPLPSEVFYAVPIGSGETLADIAGTYGIDVNVLRKLNLGMNLTDQEPAPGTVIRVPIPPEDPSQPDNPPPLPAPETSMLLIPDVPMLKEAEASLPDLVSLSLAVRPPEAPTGLQGMVKDCKVSLVWNDNGTMETGYTVWMAGADLPAQLVARLQSAPGGPAWFEIPASVNGQISYWVEAVNPIGGQPSNITLVTVDPQCPAAAPANLQFELLEITAGGDTDRVYFYISLEGAPEVRLPQEDGTFIQVRDGRGDTTAWTARNGKLALPIPSDNTLDLEGECWGWSGGTLTKLGSLNSSLGTDTWGGAERMIECGALQIGVAVKLLEAVDTRKTFGDRDTGGSGTGDDGGWLPEYTTDPSLPVPYNIVFRDSKLPWECVPECRTIKWSWDGDPKTITGFAVFVNGKLLSAAPYPDMREMVVRFPISSCGTEPGWQVAAVSGATISKLSAPPFPWYKAVCTEWIKVKFDSIEFDWTDGPGDCDTFEAYYAINMQVGGNSQTKTFFGNGLFKPLQCGVYTFQALADEVDRAYIFANYVDSKLPMSEFTDTVLLKYEGEGFSVNVRANFMDQDEWSSDDWMARYNSAIYFTSFKEALETLGCGKTFTEEDEQDKGKSRLQFTLSVYPNPCKNSPYS
jgi:hypothetical protein